MTLGSISIRFAGVALAFLVTQPLLSAEQAAPGDYPNKAIHIIAPTPPGSPPDVVARLLAQRLSTALRQPVIVDNRPGATGTVGLQAVAKAGADGYTFGILAMPFVVAPSLMPPLNYDTQRDLEPVSQVAWAANILVVNVASPLQTLEEVIAQAKEKPDSLTYASGGSGTPAHLAAALLSQRAGLRLRHVPFKGAPEGVAAVLGGHVDMMFAAAGAAAPQIKAGKLRAIGTASPTRLAAFADLPTIAELGFPGFDIRDWQGVVAPAGTPRAIIAKINEEIQKIMVLPETRAQLAASGMDSVEQAGPAVFGGLIRTESSRWSKVVRDAGIRGD